VETLPQLHWQTSELASYFHAADAVRRGRPLVEPALAEALAEPLAALQAGLQEEGVSAVRFWAHLLPLSASNISMQELARRTLIRSVGPTEAEVRVIRFRELLYTIRNTCAEGVASRERERPEGGSAELRSLTLPARQTPEKDACPLFSGWSIEPLQQRWAQYGPGLLGRIVDRTEPDILVEEATVVGLDPVQGGGGAAHLVYNLACIECVAESGESNLPEVVRLAWQIAQLNLDLPRYSEKILVGRVALVAGLAMLPVAVAAAADVRLIPAENLVTAVRAWMPEAEARLATLSEWWDTYQRLRPSWGSSLKALDLLLVGQDSEPDRSGSES